ncbi:MAG: hypothetical protein ABSH48_19445 [Verrucomicrobiota bacterium]|jgi:hypothetical protein
MKIQALLLGVVVGALASSSFAAEALLSPRAAGNQIKVSAFGEAPAIAVAPGDAAFALLSPRAAGNQIKVAPGLANDSNPAAVCRHSMNGTPKAVTECSSHANMPGCVTIAAIK